MIPLGTGQMTIRIGRRQFIYALGGASLNWSFAARGQPVERRRHVAVLMGGLVQGDVEGQAEVAALEEGLKQAGWIVGGNIEVDYRWPGTAPDRVRAAAKEVADTRPDLVFVRSTPATASLMRPICLLCSSWWPIQSVRDLSRALQNPAETSLALLI
jgi:hypothetical protein